jgi:DNA-binding PadR family transcriptional regulator
MALPILTHLQFLVLRYLINGESLSGRYLREKLAEEKALKTGPAFYQLMARLEDAGFVEGTYEQKVVDGQILKERTYQITGSGVTALEEVRNFYLENATAPKFGLLGG